MSLKDKIETNYKNSLKSKDKLQISTYRLILSAIKNQDIVNRSGPNKKETDDDDIKKLLKKMIKQRAESIEVYKKGNRQDLLEVEQKEHEIISSFLPKQLSEEETKSICNEMISKVHEFAKRGKKILVCLDSNHTHDHVLAELKAYASLASVGSYCVVFDTLIEDMPQGFYDRHWDKGDNPKTAVWEYLNTHPEFEIDKCIQNKLLITVAVDGYLKKIK